MYSLQARHGTFGRPPIAAALTRASRNRLAISSCSSCFCVLPVCNGTFSIACWKIFGISSGLFKIDRVTPVMKYHVFDGKCGYVLMECSRDGVIMDGSIAEDISKEGAAVDSRLFTGPYFAQAKRLSNLCIR